MFKRKKISATPALNHLTHPSKNVVDQSVDSSASTTQTPEVNIDTATTEAAASTTLDVSASVPKSRNTATTEDSVSTTETTASTSLDASSCVPEQGRESTDNTKPALVGTFPANWPKIWFPPAIIYEWKKSKNVLIMIGLKTKIGNLATLQCRKKMQLFVLLAWMQLEWIPSQVKMQAKHSSQMASLIGKMLGQKTEALTKNSDLRLTEKLTNVCVQYQTLVVYFCSVIYYVQ